MGDLLRQICTLRKGGCYPFSWYVGSGARKPVGFLGLANLLVGRVEKSEPAIRLFQEQEHEQKQGQEQNQNQDSRAEVIRGILLINYLFTALN